MDDEHNTRRLMKNGLVMLVGPEEIHSETDGPGGCSLLPTSRLIPEELEGGAAGVQMAGTRSSRSILGRTPRRKVAPLELVLDPEAKGGTCVELEASARGSASSKVLPLRAPDGLAAADTDESKAQGPSIKQREEEGARKRGCGRPVHPEPSVEDLEATKRCEKWLGKLRRHSRRSIRTDKVWILLDRLQLFALLWITSQPWPWPGMWLEWTQWTVVLNLDFPALGEKGAGMGTTNGQSGRSLYGQMPEYILYVAVPVVLTSSVLVVLDAMASYEGIADRVNERDGENRLEMSLVSRLRMAADGVLFRAQALTYTPCAVALVRLYQCEYLDGGRHGGWRLSADQSKHCLAWHVNLIRVLLTPAALCVLIAVPWRLSNRAERASERSRALDHEKTLVIAEIEDSVSVDGGDRDCLDWDRLCRSSYHLLAAQHTKLEHAKRRLAHASKLSGRTDSEWVEAELWVVAPFRRHAVKAETCCLLRKLGLVWCWAFLNAFPRTQGLAIFLIAFTCGLDALLRPSYRVFSTNVVHSIVEVASVANATYAMLTAWGLRSASVMPKQQTIGLAVVNGLAAVSCLTIFVLCLLIPWPGPAAKALATAIKLHGPRKVSDWILESRAARAIAVKCLSWRPVDSAPIDILEDRLADIRALWLDAKRQDTIFESTLRKSMDHLLLAHQQLADSVLHTKQGDWLADTGLLDTKAAESIRQRRHHHNLMRPQKRVLLIKLLALRKFLNIAKHKRQSRRRGASEARLKIRTAPPLDSYGVFEHT